MTTTPAAGWDDAGAAPSGPWRALRRAEWLLLALTLTVGLAAVVLALGMGRRVDWAGFAPGIAAALGMIAVGGYARQARKAPRLGAVAVGIGLFMGFTAFSGIFIFSLFPLTNPAIDTRLIAVDAMLGYNWVGFVEGLAQWPVLAQGLGYLYQSSLPQMVAVIILLGVTGREGTLARFLLTGMLCMVAAVGIWWLWPSVGPSAYMQVPDAVAQSIGLVVNDAVGAHLRMLLETGPAVIGPQTLMGVVAFPSYHIIMALMVAVYSRGTVLFWPFALAGVGMVPATLSHGGHHLVDLIAGAVVFVLVAALARRLVPGR